MIRHARRIRRHVTAAAAVTYATLILTPAAHASGSSMPWEAPLQSILQSIEGQGRDFTAMPETINAVDAWLGSAPAVLAYLFHRIGDRLDGSPTLLIIDEGWLALDDEGFAGQLREWLKTLRKKNASVIFATQSLSDIDGSPILSHCLRPMDVPGR